MFDYLIDFGYLPVKIKPDQTNVFIVVFFFLNRADYITVTQA